MRDLTYFVAISIDGFIAAPDGTADDFPVVGPHIERMVAEYPETLPAHVRPHVGMAVDTPHRHFDTVIMGLATYRPALEAGIASPYPHLRQYVVSSTLPAIDDPDVTLVRSDPIGTVRELKQQSGRGIWLAGGGRLAGHLQDEIDHLVVKTYPILLGDGIPMLRSGFAPHHFEATGSVLLDNGVIFTDYSRVRRT